MARPKVKIPKLCIDKSRNRAFCKVDGRFVSLGPAGSAKAQAAYGKLIADLAQGKTIAESKADLNTQDIKTTVNELMLRFATEEMPRYSNAEQWCMRSAIRIAREMFGEHPVEQFGPLKLRIVREAMIKKGWSRNFINKQVKRLRLIIRWGVSWELVSQQVADSLSSIKALAKGDSDAPESRKRSAVSNDKLQAVRNNLKPKHQDLFDLILLTGCRPGELTPLIGRQIDRSGEIWRTELNDHKTAHQGKERTLFFNIEAQGILSRYLWPDLDAKLFSVTRVALGNAIKRACEVAFGMPTELRQKKLTPEQRVQAREWRKQHVFTSHWLRHCVGTRVVDEMGTEAAQRLLGHSSQEMTMRYSTKAQKLAIEAAKTLTQEK